MANGMTGRIADGWWRFRWRSPYVPPTLALLSPRLEDKPSQTDRAISRLPPHQPTDRVLMAADTPTKCLLLVQLLSPLGLGLQDAESGQATLTRWEQWQPHWIWSREANACYD